MWIGAESQTPADFGKATESPSNYYRPEVPTGADQDTIVTRFFRDVAGSYIAQT